MLAILQPSMRKLAYLISAFALVQACTTAPIEAQANGEAQTQDISETVADVSADEIKTPSSAQLVESSDGTPIVVTVAGNPDGAEILFIHGYMSSTLNWTKPLNSELAKTHKLVFVDIRGFGSSGKPTDQSAYMDTQLYADDIKAAIDAAELKKPVLVTWSYGSLFLMDYIRHYGIEDISGIALISTDGNLFELPPKPEPTPEYIARVEMSRSVNIFTIRDWTNEFIEYIGGDTPQTAEETEILRVSALLVPHHVRRFMRERPEENEDLLSSLTLPVWLVTGSKDSTIRTGKNERLAGNLSDVEVTIYDDLGSMVYWHAAEQFNQDLARFVARVQ